MPDFEGSLPWVRERAHRSKFWADRWEVGEQRYGGELYRCYRALLWHPTTHEVRHFWASYGLSMDVVLDYPDMQTSVWGVPHMEMCSPRSGGSSQVRLARSFAPSWKYLQYEFYPRMDRFPSVFEHAFATVAVADSIAEGAEGEALHELERNDSVRVLGDVSRVRRVTFTQPHEFFPDLGYYPQVVFDWARMCLVALRMLGGSWDQVILSASSSFGFTLVFRGPHVRTALLSVTKGTTFVAMHQDSVLYVRVGVPDALLWSFSCAREGLFRSLAFQS